MQILVIALCKNEAKIMPHMIAHYARFADRFHIIDNQSTDGSREIARSFHHKLMPRESGPDEHILVTVEEGWDSQGETDDASHKHIKNMAYKNLAVEGDWVIIVDMDEFLEIGNTPDGTPMKMRRYLQLCDINGIVLPRVEGYHMIADEDGDVPAYTPGVLLKDLITQGVREPLYDKSAIFKYTRGFDINYTEGAHGCLARAYAKQDESAEIKLLHMRFFGEEATVARARLVKNSERNVAMGWGWEAGDAENMRKMYRDIFARKVKV